MYFVAGESESEHLEFTFRSPHTRQYRHADVYLTLPQDGNLTMIDISAEAVIETFKKPRCKMISAVLMGALIGEGIGHAAATKQMESIRPLLGKFSTELSEPLSKMFAVNLLVWAMPEEARGGFFAGDDLSLNGLAKMVGDGANDWRKLCREENIAPKTIRPLFAALKEILDELFDHRIKKKSWPQQFKDLLDDFMESFEF